MQRLVKKHYCRGYTLLELLIVLVLMGLLMGLTAPRLAQMYDSVSFSLQRDDVLFQLQSVPFMVFQRGESFRLLDLNEAPDADVLALPDGWQLDEIGTTDVTYNALGFCSGGEATFVKEDRRLRVQLDAPMCRPIVL
ncbi:prepilin-type N-terminal cleavage/methylation domain-containing protein [Alteromonas flava]|uniref:prepilin-type N-terminal cleavage/methylation domain-containing protein n=1 Tax=Alteromonas flava TaxID=2048003 RepID=UPI000C29471A|nr:prepilin-type N-terminal cleavage/methylation domain-containing protein [Alteromonas flava]